MIKKKITMTISMDELNIDNYHLKDLLEWRLSLLGAELIDYYEQEAPFGWISVEDRLPKDGELFIVTNGSDVALAYFEDWVAYDGTSQNIWENVVGCLPFPGLFNNVTHWMPMPLPPGREE